MMILDAIGTAASTHAVYFLVTAYIESLQHFHDGLGIPESVVRLPVTGIEDLEARLDCLHNHVSVPLETVLPASEVSAVLSIAVHRLGAETVQPPENR